MIRMRTYNLLSSKFVCETIVIRIRIRYIKSVRGREEIKPAPHSNYSTLKTKYNLNCDRRARGGKEAGENPTNKELAILVWQGCQNIFTS